MTLDKCFLSGSAKEDAHLRLIGRVLELLQPPSRQRFGSLKSATVATSQRRSLPSARSRSASQSTSRRSTQHPLDKRRRPSSPARVRRLDQIVKPPQDAPAKKTESAGDQPKDPHARKPEDFRHLLSLFRFARRKRDVHNLTKHNWSQRRNSTTNCGDP